MGVVAGRSLLEPGHDLETGGWVLRDRVAVEEVDDERQVAVGSVLIGHELAVLPDAQDVREIKNGGVLVRYGGVGSRQVAGMLADLDIGTSRLPAMDEEIRVSRQAYAVFGFARYLW